MKEVLSNVVWGYLSQVYFPKFFLRIEKGKEVEISIKDNCILSFKVNDHGFDLLDKFDVSLSDGDKFVAVLKEEKIIKALYSDPNFYGSIGQEFCLMYDIMYAKAGTEAIAESFYRVMENQEMDGNQSHEVLVMRTKLDWSLPPVIQCETMLDGIAKLYIEGDRKLGLKRHYLPVYRDARSQRNRDDLSKVLKRHSKIKPRLPFLH